MNKSKFLKKSLAALLAVMLVVAMIPLSAAAAAPTLSGASVSTDISGTQETTLTVDDAAGTITGNISLAAKSFTLYLLPRDNVTNNVSVSFEDLRQSDKPVKAAAEKDNDRWAIGKTNPIAFTRNDFLVDDNTVQMKITVQNDNTREQKDYTVTLNRVADPSDPTITSLRVWTKPGEIASADRNNTHVLPNKITNRVPQLNATTIDQVNKIIDITVPFDTDAVWVRDFELADGAKASITVTTTTGGTVEMSNEAIIIEGSSGHAWADAEHTDPVDGEEKDNIAWVPVKVTAGTHTSDYTLRLTRASGIESFTVQDAIDSRVFPGEGKVVVVLPFGYTNDKKDSLNNTLTVVPEFSLQYSDTDVPTLVWDTKTLKSGETKINFDSRVIVLDQYDYTVVAKRLQNAKNYEDWKESLTLTSKEQHTNVAGNKLTVSYVEGTDRTYEVIVVEPKKNYEAKINTLDIGNETATIDEAAKTIDITLPTGTDLTKVATSSIKFLASDAATVSLPMYSNVTFVEDTTSAGHDDHATTNLDRSVLTAYTQTSPTTLNLSNPITVRVKSQDGSTTADYTLNVKVSSDYVKPAITSLTLQSKDGKTNYEGKLDESTGIYTVELPYSFKTTESVKDFKLFYQKSVGSSVTPLSKTGFTLLGTETFLSTATKTGGTYFDIVSNAKDTSTKGTAITVSVRNPFTNQMESENFYILLVRKTPGHVSTLKGLNLTSNGTTGSMTIKEVNEENTYTGTIKGTDIEVKIPWSHYLQTGDPTMGGASYQESSILNALRMVAEKNDENSTIWYKKSNWNNFIAAPVLKEEAITTSIDENHRVKSESSVSWKILVLSDQLSVDLKETIETTNSGKVFDTDLTNAAKDNYTIYTLTIKQDDPKVAHVLNSVKLVGPTVKGYNVEAQDLTIQGNTITGSIPYSMVEKPLLIDYAASPRAFVLAGKNVDANSACVDAWCDTTLLKIGNNTNGQGYPNSTVGHFCDYSVYKKAACTLLPNGGAVLFVDKDGKVTMRTGYTAATPETVGNVGVDRLFVTNEDASKGVDMYTFDLTVRPASKENKITKFELEGQTGPAVINNETDTIDVTVASTVELTALKTTWELSDGATIEQNYTNESKMNYSTERLFTVVAENGTSKRTYRVNVKVQRGFVDVPEGVWFYDPIMTATDNGWMQGVGEGKFDPMGTMTRGQFALVIAKMDTTFKAEDYKDSSFPDVPSDHYASAGIAFCADKGYILGGSDGNFNADSPITREQAAIIMCKVKGISPAEGNTTFADNANISDWSIGYVKAATAAGYFQGIGNNEFAPQRTLMRCEGATILVRSANAK